jgi:uncharacterized membrane protein YcaP (DUF421 family)
VLTNNITVAQLLVGFVILIGLQFCVAFMVVRWSYLRTIVNPPPTLLLHCGKFVQTRRQRVAEADICAAVRRQGIGRIEEVGTVILEADGTFSVIKELEPNASALADIPELGGSRQSPTTK